MSDNFWFRWWWNKDFITKWIARDALHTTFRFEWLHNRYNKEMPFYGRQRKEPLRGALFNPLLIQI